MLWGLVKEQRLWGRRLLAAADKSQGGVCRGALRSSLCFLTPTSLFLACSTKDRKVWPTGPLHFL